MTVECKHCFWLKKETQKSKDEYLLLFVLFHQMMDDNTSTGAEAEAGEEVPEEPGASYLTLLPMNCVLNVVRPAINAVLNDSGADGARVKLSNEARQCFLDCATELVMFLTQEASDRCGVGGRRTLSGADIVTAVETLGFGAQYAAVARMALSQVDVDAPLSWPLPHTVLPAVPSEPPNPPALLTTAPEAFHLPSSSSSSV